MFWKKITSISTSFSFSFSFSVQTCLFSYKSSASRTNFNFRSNIHNHIRSGYSNYKKNFLYCNSNITAVIESNRARTINWKKGNFVPGRFVSQMETSNKSIKFLSQKDAQELDQELMSTEGFLVEQLMELAGLSVATAIAKVFPLKSHPKPLIICGPGNNGGDGLVASRHLVHFGYKPTIVYPKPTQKALYQALVTQCKALDVPVLTTLPTSFEKDFHLIVDGIFGFSFAGEIRAPFDTIIKELKVCKLPIASIDVPSGWLVDEGNVSGQGLDATMLISLSAPKICSRQFKGPYHFLGGRFIPPHIADKYKLNLPQYPGMDSCVDLNLQSNL